MCVDNVRLFEFEVCVCMCVWVCESECVCLCTLCVCFVTSTTFADFPERISLYFLSREESVQCSGRIKRGILCG